MVVDPGKIIKHSPVLNKASQSSDGAVTQRRCREYRDTTRQLHTVETDDFAEEASVDESRRKLLRRRIVSESRGDRNKERSRRTFIIIILI